MNNEIKSKWPRKLWRFFVRLLTYQFIFFWIYMKYYNFSKHATLLKSKSYEALAAFNTRSALVDEIFTFPELIIRIITYLEAFLFVFALFGQTQYGIYLSIISLFTTLLYNNPFLPVNLKQFWFGVSPDFIMGMGVSLSLMVSAIRPHCCDITDDWNPWEFEDDEDENDEDDEYVKEKDLSTALNMSSKKVAQHKKKKN